jgi:hypothetical protein
MKRSFFIGLLSCLFLINAPMLAKNASPKKTIKHVQALPHKQFKTQPKQSKGRGHKQNTKQIPAMNKNRVVQSNLAPSAATADPMKQIATLPPEDQLKAQQIAKAHLIKLKDFYDKIAASPELDLSYRQKINTKLKQVATINLPSQGMTPEETLLFLRSVNKKLKERSFKQRQATVKTVNDQLADAHRQAMSLQNIPLSNIPIPSGHGAMLKMASFTPLNIPATPEIPIIGSPVALDSYDTVIGTNDEIRAGLIKGVAKESRDFGSQAASQDVLTSDIREANRANRSAINAVDGSNPTESGDFSAAQRERRRLEVEGLKK